MSVPEVLRKRLSRLRRGAGDAIAPGDVEPGRLSDRDRTALEERTNINHTGNSPDGPTNNSGGGIFSSRPTAQRAAWGGAYGATVPPERR